MKKILPAVFLLSGFSVFSPAQTWIWGKGATGTGTQEGHSIATDGNGNVFLTGAILGFSSTIIFGTDTLSSISGNTVYLTKYDLYGNELWAKSAEGIGFSVCTDAGGNAFITGSFNSATNTFGTYTLTNAGNNDIFLVKYDPNGNVIWAISAGGAGNDVGNSVCTDINGNVFLTGSFSSYTLGTYTINPGAGILAKYNSAGNLVWAKSGGGSSVSTDINGNVFIARDSLVKYDTNGNFLWASPGGGISVCTDAGGNAFITGSFYSTNIAFGTYTLTNAGFGDVFLVKYDPNGNVLWAKGAGGSSMDVGYSVSTDACKNVYICGSFDGFGTLSVNDNITFGSYVLAPPPGSYDPTFIVKYDSLGNVLCASALASGGDDQSSASADKFGNVYIGGDFYMQNPFIVGTNVLAQTASENAFVAKYTCQCAVSIIGKNNLCRGDNDTLSFLTSGNCNMASFLWNTGATTHTIVVNPLTETTYSLAVTNSCFPETAYKTIMVNPLPTADAGENVSICIGNITSLSASGGTDYFWIPSANLSSNSIANPIANPLVTVNYTVVVIDINGCTNNDFVKVTVNPAPSVFAGQDATISSGSTIVLSASGNGLYDWSPVSGLSCVSCQSPQASPLNTTTYHVTLTNANGCIKTDSVIVNVLLDETLFIPNSFSPDGNDKNDVFYIYGTEIKSIDIKIFNRWGQLIASGSRQLAVDSKDVAIWDGKYKNETVKEDVYVLLINCIWNSGKEETVNKNIFVIR